MVQFAVHSLIVNTTNCNHNRHILPIQVKRLTLQALKKTQIIYFTNSKTSK